MEFLVKNSAPCGHPLDVAWPDSSAATTRIAVREFTLVDDGDSLESFMRVPADPALLGGGRKLMGRRIIEQQKWAQLPPESVIVENGADMKPVADPMSG